MANRKAKKRPFVKVYWDFLDSDVLQTRYQKVMYIYLKFFSDKEGECSPSFRQMSSLVPMGVNKIRSVLDELIEMGLVKKIRRYFEDGGNDSNLYIFKDSAETWGAENRKDWQRPFVKVYKDLLADKKFGSCQEVLVYIYLGRFADEKLQCSLSGRALSEAAGVSIPTVGMAVNRLEEQGLIEKQGGEGETSYTLLASLKKT